MESRGSLLERQPALCLLSTKERGILLPKLPDARAVSYAVRKTAGSLLLLPLLPTAQEIPRSPERLGISCVLRCRVAGQGRGERVRRGN